MSQHDDEEAVRHWFEELAAHVREVDFADARRLFAEDMVGFGSFTDFMIGRESFERLQWRNVWPHIDHFRFRPDIRAIVAPDRLQAIGLAVWDSTGYHRDGTEYDRPGRATVGLRRGSPADPFVAVHTHFSLFRDVPTQSFKSKPEKA
jgi:ketosteroid isomerase-like protein